MPEPSYEGGLRPDRIEFDRESTPGQFNTDPAWLLFSDNVVTSEPTIQPQPVAQDGLGDPDTVESNVSMEASEWTITYDLNQWLVDGGGAAQDAAYDAFARDSDNRIPNTHTVVSRMDQSDLKAANTENGSTSYDTRQYFVGVGGLPNEATISVSPSDSAIWQVELAYLFEYVRMYKVDQPDSSTELTVKSTDSADTSITVTIENEGAGTTEDVSLDGSDGTTVVSTSETFGDIDAIEVTADHVGDIAVSINDGTQASPTEGDELARIHGSDSYDHGESDDGIPALGSGSHASALGSGLESAYDGDTLERPSGTAIGENVAATEIAASNNVEGGARATSPFPALSAGGRDVEVASTVYGEAERIQHIRDMLQSNTDDYVWTPSASDTLTISSPVVTEVSAAEEANQGRMEVEVTLANQQGVTVA